jgi:hypothetical protein
MQLGATIEGIIGSEDYRQAAQPNDASLFMPAMSSCGWRPRRRWHKMNGY